MHSDPLTSLTAALLVGLLGSGHCLGMCGGIASALGMSAQRPSRLAGLGLNLLYNLGRISSYAIAGALVGALGGWLGTLLNLPAWSIALRLMTGLVLIAIGLQLATAWRGLRHMEVAGARLWRLLSPLARRLLPVRHPLQAWAAGMVWGWLPCGLVYSMLLTAAVSGGPAQGAGVMFAFGAGTLPAMVLVGSAAHSLRRWSNHRGLRRGAGVLIVFFGLWTLATPLMALSGGGHHGM
ncbi:sulfite exporter TauE/SafE family protein [Alkalilimnicola sp. S0819]|uniref:sulfite exporter TauE/SafE family protein n=1 Tax=Alkalilimnicola sp. S0819 TaxID=2613922 RepID=UPI001262A31E|nr:sulfite exporter TauE/SafE family protein [Alkalilimnicola sp. S0819]KAB7628194.1 sulfite exporter TauE/SafE family protein [Alkalilimnicola sp. S0819]MPQ15083.1 sulfite exporter TauE/SafE family protein [Alkalilimnicola sp. S0819]